MGVRSLDDSLKVGHRAQRLLTDQIIAALRVASAYRTVLASAVLVIAGMTPIVLQAEEIINIFKTRLNGERQSVSVAETRYETIKKRQSRWNSEKQGRWNAKLITDFKKWVNKRHGNSFLSVRGRRKYRRC